MVKIKEIRILEPKIKEVKKEKPEEEEVEEEEEFLDEDFIDENLDSEIVSERRRRMAEMRRRILESRQEAGKNLEQKIEDVPSGRVEENPKLGDFYKGSQNDFYGDSKKVYSGSGEQGNKGYESGMQQDKKREDLLDQQKYLHEERRDSNPLEKFGIKEKKHSRTL